MSYSSFLDTIEEGSLSRIYIFFGEEDFLKDEAEDVLAKRIKRHLNGEEPDRIVFHANEVGPADVEEACSYTSLFGGLRFIVLGELEDWSTKDQKRFSEFLKETGPSPGAVLLVRTNLRKLPVTVKGIVSNIFWKPFDRDMLRWVDKRLRDGGVSFDRDVPRLLVDLYAGEDVKGLRYLAGEVDKLILYMGKGGAITTATVRQVCSAPPQAEWFRFIEAVSMRRSKEALGLSHAFLHSDPRGAVGFLTILGSRLADLLALRTAGELHERHWRSLVSLCERRKQPRLRRNDRAQLDKEIGEMRAELASLVPGPLKSSVTSPSPFAFFSRIIEANGFTCAELARAVSATATVECNLKSGEGDPLTELDVLLTKICIPGLLFR